MNESKPYTPVPIEPMDPGPVETRQPWMIIRDLTAERDEARAQRDNLRQLLRDHCADFDGQCSEKCDNWGHAEECRMVSFAADHRALKKELAELKEFIHCLP